MSSYAQHIQVNLIDSTGHVVATTRLALGQSVSVGRSLACELSAADVHLAATHAKLSLSADGVLHIAPHDSLNGTYLNHVRLPSNEPTAITQDCELELGGSRLQIRLQREDSELAPELVIKRPREPLQPSRSSAWLGRPAVLATGAVLAIGIVALNAWAEQTQAREVWVTLTQMLLAQLAGVAAWVGLWALISRVSRGAPHWVAHASIAFGVAALLFAVDWLIDVGAFAFSVLLPRQLGWWLLGGFALLLLFLHLRSATPFSRRRAFVVAACLPVLMVGLRYWQVYGTEAGMAGNQTPVVALFPPAMRLAGASTPEAFFSGAQAMKTELLKKREKQAADDASGAGGDDDYEDY
jgi:hypothetical protein